MSLDLIAAGGCFWLALIIFVLHVVSSPRRPSWMAIPEYVRCGFLVTGTMFLWRAVNLATLSTERLGHVNAEGVMVQVALVYTITAAAVAIVRVQMKNQGWARLEWLQKAMRKNPAIVPVGMTVAEVAETLVERGAVVAEPPAPTGHA